MKMKQLSAASSFLNIKASAEKIWPMNIATKIRDHKTHVIRLRLDNVQQLFNSLDPSPFVGRDLDADAEAFIFDWAAEYPASGDFCLELTLTGAFDDKERNRVEAAIHNYFSERARFCQSERRQLMREGRLSLLIGLLFLGFCMGMSRALENHVPASGFAALLSEGLMVGGWVAMWRPMEIFLYRWWPLVRRRRIYRRLADMAVVVVENPQV